MHADLQAKNIDKQTSSAVTLSLDQVTIENLSDYPHWLETVAHWHTDGFQRSRQQASADGFSKRLTLLREQLSDDQIPFTYIAHRDDRLLGCISLVAYQRLGGMSPSYWIANVFVDEPFRCQGLSTNLLTVMEARAQAQSISELYLYATDQVNYYRNRGWQEVRRKTIGGCSASIMRKSLCVSY